MYQIGDLVKWNEEGLFDHGEALAENKLVVGNIKQDSDGNIVYILFGEDINGQRLIFASTDEKLLVF